jgi:hypothetical protein
MLDIAFVWMLATWAAVVGLAILSRLDAVPAHRGDGMAMAIPLGLGVLSLAALGLGEIGWLDRAGLCIVFGTGIVVSSRLIFARVLPTFPGATGRTRPVPCRPGEALVGYGQWHPIAPAPPALDRPAPWLDRAFGLSLIITLVGTFLTALAPVTDGDALCYHLQVPKQFLLAHTMTFDPDLHETVYPLVTEMLYAVALAFRGPIACRLIQWVLGVCFAANVAALARPALGDRAWWAGTIALLVPAVSNGMSAPLNDVALAAYGNAALAAVMLCRDRPTARRAVLAGILAGLAIGVKYPALVWGGVLGIAMLVPFSKGVLTEPGTSLIHALSPGGRGRRLQPPGEGDRLRPSLHDEAMPGVRPLTPPLKGRPSPSGGEGESSSEIVRSNRSDAPMIRLASVFALAAICVGGPWYLRAYMHTGNPVYPFFRHVFGGSGIDDVLDPIKRPMVVTAWNLVTALGPMTLDPDRFDSVSHQFGPAFLLFLPGFLLLRPPKRVVVIAAIGFAFLTLCLTQRQSMRFVLAAVGPFSVAAAWVAKAWSRRDGLAARGLVGVLGLILMFEAAIAAGHARHGITVAFGRESENEYLLRREPTYRVGRWIDAHLPREARMIGQEHRGYYLARPYAMELAHRRRTNLGSRGETADQVIATLRDEGFSHLLTCPPDPEDAVEFDGLLTRRLAPWLASRRPLYEEAITDPDGVTRRYRIDALDEASVALAKGGISR